MEKKIPLILIAFIILLGSCAINSSDYDKETIEKAEATAKSYIKNNFTEIETIEIEEVYRNEMGGMSISGTVNNKAAFHIGMDETSMDVGSIGTSEGFPDKKEDYDLETREKAATVAESYLKSNYKDIEIIEVEGITRGTAREDMKVNGVVNTYGFVMTLNESDFTVEDIEVYQSTEGLHAKYEKPE